MLAEVSIWPRHHHLDDLDDVRSFVERGRKRIPTIARASKVLQWDVEFEIVKSSTNLRKPPAPPFLPHVATRASGTF